MAWVSVLANGDIPHTQIPWSANTEPCHADWRKREGKKCSNVKIIHPNKRDSMKVTGQNGELCGRTSARNISLIWWKASLGGDNGWWASSLYGILICSLMAFILHVCHIGLLTHIGTNLCLPKKETAVKSNLYAVLSKMIIKCEEWEQLRLCQHIRPLNEMGLQCGNLPSVSQYRFALLPQRMAFNRLVWEMRKKVWVCQSQAPPPPVIFERCDVMGT